MLNMINDLEDIGHTLTNEQQVSADSHMSHATKLGASLDSQLEYLNVQKLLQHEKRSR